MALLIGVVCISVVAQTGIGIFFSMFAIRDGILGFVVTFLQTNFDF